MLDKLNTVRDPLIVERILIANSRTRINEIRLDSFESELSLVDAVSKLKNLNKPFVVRGAGKCWKLVERFRHFEPLLKRCKIEHDERPDRKYTVYKPDGDGHLNQSHATPFGFMTLYQYLIKGKQNALYLLGVPDKQGRGASPFDARKNEKDPPIFAEDIDSDARIAMYIDLFTGCLKIRRHVFMNYAYSFTNLHYDTDWNMYLCALGHRRWTLAHPAQARVLGSANGSANYSDSIPIRGLNALGGNRLAELVKFLSVDLEASDLLFVPPTWWHVVEACSSDLSCGVNWFFTFPRISTTSPLDKGWPWMNASGNLMLSSGMGAHFSSSSDRMGEGDADEDDDEQQPSGIHHNLASCYEDDFLGIVEREIAELYAGCSFPAYMKLKELLLVEYPDRMIARQMLRIAINSCKTDLAVAETFETLCEEILLILNRRRVSMRPKRKR
jgi:hypothetical protein